MPEKRSVALLRSFIKLAAIGTVADVVALVGENRALVSLGLRALTTVRNPGLRALLDAAGIPAGRMPTGREIAFRLAPRINAAGRIGDASLIMNLLGTADQDEVHCLVRHLEKLNRQRKVEQSRILRGIAGLPRSEFLPTVLVFSHSGWHRGVLGIAAARLVDEHRKPVFVLSEETDWAYGSGRSVPGVNLAALLETTRHHLETFGGHEQAAGLTIRKNRRISRGRVRGVRREISCENPRNRFAASPGRCSPGMERDRSIGAVRSETEIQNRSSRRASE
jgi:single-stranded-DNA-specific exonuclease